MDFGASEQHYYILSDIINFSEYLTFLSSVEMWSHVARSNAKHPQLCFKNEANELNTESCGFTSAFNI